MGLIAILSLEFSMFKKMKCLPAACWIVAFGCEMSKKASEVLAVGLAAFIAKNFSCDQIDTAVVNCTRRE